MRGPGTRRAHKCWVTDCGRPAFTSVEVVVYFKNNDPFRPVKERHYVCTHHVGRMAPPLRSERNAFQ